jgi:FkbM family methyltransferase
LFELDPNEAVDGAMLFYPHLYLRNERRWLEDNVRRGDVFVDGGAYLGAFALLAERLGARAFAIEANPETFVRLQTSLSLNGSDVTPVNVGLSDAFETCSFRPQRSGNAGGSAFVSAGGDVHLQCVPLAHLVRRCDVLKLDVEGMEHKVLTAYLPHCRPRVLILEAFGDTEALALCLSEGYRLVDRTAENCLLVSA